MIQAAPWEQGSVEEPTAEERSLISVTLSTEGAKGLWPKSC